MRRGGVVASSRRRSTTVTPDQLANLRGWWKADGITSPPADGAALQTWTDSSTSAQPFVQATVGNRPTYRTSGAFLPNGQPCVEFTAASSRDMSCSTLTNVTAMTRFVVVRMKTLPSTGTLFGANNGFQLAFNSAGQLQSSVNNVTWLNISGTTVATTGVWYVVAFTDNNSNSSTNYVNGTQDATSTTAHSATATTTSLGSASATAFLDGYIAEMADWNRVLNTTELGQMFTYFTTKYAVGTGGGSSGGGTGTATYRNFDFDTSETQANSGLFGWESGQAHQHAWITSPTRLGAGHSERFEVHNTSADMLGNFRSLMGVYNTNEGGTTSGSIVGYPDVYWCVSYYVPTSGAGDPNATVVSGFSQSVLPPILLVFELHERGNINGSTVGINNLSDVSNLALLFRSGQLQFRGRCGQWTWNGSSWNNPAWNTFTPGTNGSNDQIPLPIVKPGGTNATMPLNVWIDVIFHVRFATNSTGLVELWARQAGQAFTTSPNLSITGPTHKSVLGSDGVTRTSADVDVANGVTGCYLEVGCYEGSTGWGDGTNGAHVLIVDELRRYDALVDAKANWG